MLKTHFAMQLQLAVQEWNMCFWKLVPTKTLKIAADPCRAAKMTGGLPTLSDSVGNPPVISAARHEPVTKWNLEPPAPNNTGQKIAQL